MATINSVFLTNSSHKGDVLDYAYDHNSHAKNFFEVIGGPSDQDCTQVDTGSEEPVLENHETN